MFLTLQGSRGASKGRTTCRREEIKAPQRGKDAVRGGKEKRRKEEKKRGRNGKTKDV